MSVTNIKFTAFTATSSANQVVGSNPLRRGLRIQVYGPPDVTANVTVWVDYSGNQAVPFQCMQIISGAIFDWGRPDTREFTRAQNLSNCPTGPISVIVVGATSAQGFIEELD